MNRKRLRALAKSIRRMQAGAPNSADPTDTGRIGVKQAITRGPLPDLFSMDVWFSPHADNPMQTAMGICGCAVRLYAREAQAEAGSGSIDLYEAAKALLGLNQQSAWALFCPRGFPQRAITSDDAATACERLADSHSAETLWQHVRERGDTGTGGRKR